MPAVDPSFEKERRLASGAKLALLGIVTNTLLAAVKILAGILGNCYALIADGIESLLDIFGSAVLWFGLKLAAEPPDEEHPYGHGKAEPLAAVGISLLVIAAALGLAIQSVREILTPHHAPAPFTLFVLVAVIVVKELLFRKVTALVYLVYKACLICPKEMHLIKAGYSSYLQWRRMWVLLIDLICQALRLT
jgi:divalent metal cation (Fe/Co/Zn/Cd) transporter